MDLEHQRMVRIVISLSRFPIELTVDCYPTCEILGVLTSINPSATGSLQV